MLLVPGVVTKEVTYDEVTSGRLPLLVAMIALVTYLGLVLILRSLFLPAIAVILNLLTVAAAFGILSLLFVGNNPPLGGAGSLDVLSAASIFTIMFALSIDYQVFLLTRMREEYVRTQSHRAAIDFGISRTARVVTMHLTASVPRSSCATVGAAGSTCSKLSRTRSVRFVRSPSISASIGGREPVCVSPTAVAIAGATSAGSLIGASGTK